MTKTSYSWSKHVVILGEKSRQDGHGLINGAGLDRGPGLAANGHDPQADRVERV